jgi:hypothetical protein
MSVLEKIRPTYADKKEVAKRAKVEGIKLRWPDVDDDGYVEFCKPFSAKRESAKNGQPERIECRCGCNAITAIGWYLKTYYRGIEAQTLAVLEQTPKGQPVEHGTPYILELRLNQFL